MRSFPRSRILVLVLGLTCGLLCAGPSSSCAGAEPIDPAAESALRRLVQDLGAPSFHDREKATLAILKQGIEAKGVLQEFQADADLEIRKRVVALLKRIDAADLDRRLAAFVADVKGEHDHHLPGWKAFGEQVGNDTDCRKLFGELFRFERPVLELCEGSPDTLKRVQTPLLQARIQQTMQEMNNRAQFTGTYGVDAETAMAFFFVASHPHIEIDTTSSQYLYNFIYQPKLQAMLQQGPHKGPALKVLEGWIMRSLNNGMHLQAMALVTRYQLKRAAVPVAIKMLGQKRNDHELHSAIVLLGEHGEADHISHLLPFLQTGTAIQISVTPGKTVSVPIRDAALASLVRMTKQDLKAYGFEEKQTTLPWFNGMINYPLLPEAQRTAAFKKWDEWKAKQPATTSKPAA